MPTDKRKIIDIVAGKGNEPIYDRPITIRLPKDVMEELEKLEAKVKEETKDEHYKKGKSRKRSKIIVELLRDALRIKAEPK